MDRLWGVVSMILSDTTILAYLFRALSKSKILSQRGSSFAEKFVPETITCKSTPFIRGIALSIKTHDVHPVNKVFYFNFSGPSTGQLLPNIIFGHCCPELGSSLSRRVTNSKRKLIQTSFSFTFMECSIFPYI